MFLLKEPWHLYGLFFPLLPLFLCPGSPECNLDFIFFLMVTEKEKTFFFLSFPASSFFILRTYPICTQICVSSRCVFLTIVPHSQLFQILPCFQAPSLPLLTLHFHSIPVPTQAPGQLIGVSTQALKADFET